ncbi:PREDICTED: uncharacterized protein LOC109208677 [Nicotiana attenuata]|uniref:uncharacterized protein LOC109208677 n=1 Tax=Nicotiana attenuata TaxID=49451 RepID=UPI000904922B|nr:PREDICTED: uncharacterized protein LOC109208677 [Nicotiana attenuata]
MAFFANAEEASCSRRPTLIEHRECDSSFANAKSKVHWPSPTPFPLREREWGSRTRRPRISWLCERVSLNTNGKGNLPTTPNLSSRTQWPSRVPEEGNQNWKIWFLKFSSRQSETHPSPPGPRPTTPTIRSLQDPTLEDSEDVKAKRNKREDDELLYRGHILNTLTDRLYDRYQNLTSPREIWMALQTTYENEKRGIDKSLSLQYFEFKMVDTKPIMDQIHELKILVSKLTDLDVKIPDALQISAILSKLPCSWNDYRKKIMHSSEKLTVE